MSYADSQKTMDLIRTGVQAQAESLQAQQDKLKAEQESKEPNAVDIDIKGGNDNLTNEQMQTTIKDMAGAIMELTSKLEKLEKGGNQ